jgi:two-component sensor histidine kinase
MSWTLPVRLRARLGSFISHDAPLSARLTLLVLAGVVPLLMFNLVVTYVRYLDDRAGATHETLVLSRAIGRSVEGFLNTRTADLVALAESRSLLTLDLATFRPKAERVLHQQFSGGAILLSRPDGQLLLDTRVEVGVALPNSDGQKPTINDDRPAVSGIFVPAGATRPVVALAVPVHGTTDLVLTLYIDLGAFAPLIEREKPADGWIAAIIDQNGFRVARSPPANLVAQRVTPGGADPWPTKPEATFEGISPLGAPVFAAYSALPRIGWRASVAVQTDVLTGPAWRSAMLSFAAALVPLVIGTLLQRKISHGITVPLATLHRIATAPDSDRFDSDSAKTGMREADEVAHALIAEKRSRHEARANLERALEQRTAALGQRDLLLREVYHRVKNNLQLVDGLLALHMSQTANCEVVAELSDLRSRVYALGLVHQQLMTSADLESFDIAPFLHQLADNVLAAGGGADCVMRVEAVRLIVTLDFAIPLGLLVNELLTNCFKHSYPSGCSEISVRLVRNAVGDVLLTVSSTNQELPETARGLNTTGDFSYTQGQGVEIITGLVAQIDGVMQVCDGNPYTTEITIAAESFNGG